MNTEERVDALNKKYWELVERIGVLARALGYNFKYVPQMPEHYELEKMKPTATEAKKK